MKLGISSHTLKWSFGIPGYPQPAVPLDGEKLIVKAAGFGVDLVQFGDNYPLHLGKREELARLKAVAEERGIVLEIGTAGTDPRKLLDYLQMARLLGAGLVRTRLAETDLPENMETARRNLSAVVQQFERQGVVLVLENYELYPVEQLAGLIKQIDNAALGACLDTGNSVAALEAPEQVVKALAPYARCLHIKDFRFRRADHGLGYTVEGCPVGEGMLNVDRIFHTLGSEAKILSVVLEQWTPYQGGIEDTVSIQDLWIKKSLQYLKRLVP
jgi:sugar phosphate isomerase/epimerase